jgi:hypothetical protein
MMDRIERIRQSFITRKTDQSDTREQIQRHDPDYQKNKYFDKNKHWDDHEEDLTDISLDSLIFFLEGLKKDDNTAPPQQNDTANNPMNKAIAAYGANTPKPQKRFTCLDDENAVYDREEIDVLIQKLQEIQMGGFDHITLLPAEGFLESIEKTIEAIHLSNEG